MFLDEDLAFHSSFFGLQEHPVLANLLLQGFGRLKGVRCQQFFWTFFAFIIKTYVSFVLSLSMSMSSVAFK